MMTISQRTLFGCGVFVLLARIALAHCDGLDGPVVQAAQKAIATGDVNLVLIWVQKSDEDQIKKTFEETLAVRKLSPQARQLADGDSASWKILAGLALSLSRTKPHDRTKPDRVPAKNARTIAAVIERASFAAEKSGRQRVTTDDVKAAIRVEFPNFDFGNPSAPDTAIADPSQLADRNAFAAPLQPVRKTAARPVHTARQTEPGRFSILVASG